MFVSFFYRNMQFFKPLCMRFKTSTKLVCSVRRLKTVRLYETWYQLHKINPLKITCPYQNLHRKYCFDSFKVDDSDSDNDESEHRRDIKNIVLPNTNDTLATKICECKSLQNIFDLLNHNIEQINWKNVTMAIAMVRELQLIYYQINTHERNLVRINITHKDNFENILTNANFLNLLNLIEKHYEFMDIHCLSYCLLCLQKLGINCTINKKLSQRLSKILITSPIEEIKPYILSRFIASIVSHKDLSTLNTIKDVWPVVLKKMSKYDYKLCLVKLIKWVLIYFIIFHLGLCDSYDDLRHISICLYSSPWFLNKSIMNDYVCKVKSILFDKPYNYMKVKCTIKVLKLLNNPYCSSQNFTIKRSLLLDLCGVVKTLTLNDMIQLQMV